MFSPIFLVWFIGILSMMLMKMLSGKHSVTLFLISSLLFSSSCATHEMKRKSKALQQQSASPEEATRSDEPERQERAEEKQGDKNRGIFHIVRKAENLYRIAKTYGINVQELAEINGIKDPAKIQAGQVIFIPGAEKQLEILIPGKMGTISYSGEKFTWPVSGKIGSSFGARRNGHYHSGIDIMAPYGTAVVASRDGIVVFSGHEQRYGRMIIINHQDGTSTVYAHNSINLVKEGDEVSRGETIAQVGTSGNATGPHLHFEIRVENDCIDPYDYLEQNVGGDP
ncbi:MAG: LysM peptidoglycan-binding domain-containing M23 family metallopeptidase [Acidobacteriota bacterium]